MIVVPDIADTGYTGTDLFSGAGGLSDALQLAGVRPVFCANHDPVAVETHGLNHPDAEHACDSVQRVTEDDVPRSDFLVAGPECTNHSLAKGRRVVSPEAQRSRFSVWELYRFTARRRYLAVVVENVPEFAAWDGFETWVREMELLGYSAQVMSLNAMHCGVPQSRDRIFVLLTRADVPRPDTRLRPRGHCTACDRDVETYQAWKPTKWLRGRRFASGRYGRQYVYRCAHCGTPTAPYTVPAITVIDRSAPLQRIGDREHSLASATLRRVDCGIDKFWREPLRRAAAAGIARVPVEVLGTAWPQPFAVHLYGSNQGERSASSLAAPMGALTAQGNHHGIVIPDTLITSHFSAGTEHGVMREGPGGWTRPADTVMGTITAIDHHSVLRLPRAFTTSYYGTSTYCDPDRDPLGAVTTVDRHALVVRPDDIGVIRTEDALFRMLTPRECGLFQDFAPDHRLPAGITHRDTTRLYGNAVPKRMAAVPIAAAVQALAA